MEKLRILLIDVDEQELDVYGKVCRAICGNLGYQSDVRVYTNNQQLLFDMGDPYFLNTVNIIIIEPDSANEAIAATLRKMGYCGIILYLSQKDSFRFSIQAFDAKVSNYLHKGMEHLPRFKSVFEQAVFDAEQLWNDFILVSKGGECRRIELQDIRYIESYGHDLIIHYDGGEFAFRSTFADLKERLPENMFIQVHKSFLVSAMFVNLISHEALSLDDGTQIPIGRGNYPALKSAVGMGSNKLNERIIDTDENETTETNA